MNTDSPGLARSEQRRTGLTVIERLLAKAARATLRRSGIHRTPASEENPKGCYKKAKEGVAVPVEDSADVTA